MRAGAQASTATASDQGTRTKSQASPTAATRPTSVAAASTAW